MKKSLPGFSSKDTSDTTSNHPRLNIPLLVETVVQDLYRSQPTEPRQVLYRLHQLLQEKEPWYYQTVTEEFFDDVERLRRKLSAGSPGEWDNASEKLSSSSSASEYTVYHMNFEGSGKLRRKAVLTKPISPLFFDVPMISGRCFELYPSSKQLNVSSANRLSFCLIMDAYERFYGRKNTSGHYSAEYIKAILPHLPLQAPLYLQSKSYPYETALLFMELYVCVREKCNPWRASPEEWASLQIIDAVPFRGKLYPVDYTPKGKYNPRSRKSSDFDAYRFVALEDAHVYIEAARLKLFHLEKVWELKREKSLRREQPSSSNNQKEGVGGGDSITQEEIDFWEHLHRFAKHPELIPPQSLSFVLNLPFGKVYLLPNGQYLSVDKVNITHFVELAKQKRREIHKGFTHPPDTTEGSSPTGKSEDKEPEYLPALSFRWNSFVLGEEDLGSFTKGMRLAELYREMKDANTVDTLLGPLLQEFSLYFCLYCFRGTYDLIPSGRWIKVTSANVEEYLQRHQYAYQQIVADNGLEDDDEEEGGERVEEEEEYSVWTNPIEPDDKDAVKEATTTTMTTRAVGVPNPATDDRRISSNTEEEGGPNVPNNPLNIIPTDPSTKLMSPTLQKSDIPFLREFEEHLDVLNTNRKTAKRNVNDIINRLNLQWGIAVPEHQTTLPLTPPSGAEGSNTADIRVNAENFDEYYYEAKKKIGEVILSIKVYGQFPRPGESRKNSESQNEVNRQ